MYYILVFYKFFNVSCLAVFIINGIGPISEENRALKKYNRYGVVRVNNMRGDLSK